MTMFMTIGGQTDDQPLQITQAEKEVFLGLSTATALLILIADGDPTGLAVPAIWAMIFGAMDRMKARHDAEDAARLNEQSKTPEDSPPE